MAGETVPPAAGTPPAAQANAEVEAVREKEQVFQIQVGAEHYGQSKAWRFAKDILNLSIIVVALAGFSLSLSLLKYLALAYPFAVTCGPVCFVAMVWSATELLVKRASKGRGGIHPGAHIGMTLVLWLAAVILAVFVFLGFMAFDVEPSGCCQGQPIPEFYAEDDMQRAAQYCREFSVQRLSYEQPRLLALGVFMIVIWLLELFMFIGACVDTARWNRLKPQPILVMPRGGSWVPAQDHRAPSPQRAPLPVRAASAEGHNREQQATPAPGTAI